MIVSERPATYPFVVVREGERYNIVDVRTGRYRFARSAGLREREAAEASAEAWQAQVADQYAVDSTFIHQ